MSWLTTIRNVAREALKKVEMKSENPPKTLPPTQSVLNKTAQKQQSRKRSDTSFSKAGF